MPRALARRNVRLYVACGELVREVDRAASEGEAAGLHRLAQWMRRSVLSLALLVSEEEPDEPRIVREVDRVEQDLVVFTKHVGACTPALRAIVLLERVRVMVEVPSGAEGTPQLVTDPLTTAPPG